MADIEELVAKFRTKLLAVNEAEKYKKEVVDPLVNRVFIDNFSKVFEDLVNKINEQLGSKILSFIQEGKNRFAIEGQYHRVYFQKGKVDTMEALISVDIIPIYIWKGVTKHLGPITFFTNPVTEDVKWDIPLSSVEEYSKNLFGKLIDDEDFSM